MRYSFGAAFAAAIVALSGPASATELRLLSSWDASYTAVPNIVEVFMDSVAEASGGDTTITMTGPEAVPPFEQLQPVSLGIFDLLFTHGGYHSGETGISTAIDAIEGDPAKRRESGVWDWLDAYYQENHNLKLISIPTALTGYQILLRQPMADGKLTGLKVRGTSVYHGLIEALGGAPVILPAGEMYAAAERGIVDGISWPAVGAIGFKLCEVTPNMVRPSFGAVSYLIFMNLDKFNALDESEQQLLLSEGEKLEENTVATFEEILADEDAQMIACGARIDEQDEAWGAEAQKAFAEKAWSMAAEQSGEKAEEFRAFAREKGMTE
ncbi:C4-dicarboxylate ABC transporter substrate-binding protein [Acuticoccus sp. M5D2P5]|uniref:C4-dicarboxylate ABC transporter substrate-binding protein n=1 Tax=Acuticoccus kalidii TaxID=2910977 RepID=UPI001F1A4410|nr:C4-dicarboxylate ABC transporter substrate-binding protein [Acuticoccus kalidii]MCF3934959.1 C4-dicarboxylate ABC transporter substrate-binding protein [Acuticoccus kalidii]